MGRSKIGWAHPHLQDPPVKSKSSRHQCNPKADQDVVKSRQKQKDSFPILNEKQKTRKKSCKKLKQLVCIKNMKLVITIRKFLFFLVPFLSPIFPPPENHKKPKRAPKLF